MASGSGAAACVSRHIAAWHSSSTALSLEAVRAVPAGRCSQRMGYSGSTRKKDVGMETEVV